MDNLQDVLSSGDKNKVQHREYSISCINLQQKRIRNRICIYVYLNHFAVHQKIIQHCKSTILQFKKKFQNSVYTKMLFASKMLTFSETDSGTANKKTGIKLLWLGILGMG